MPKKKSLDKIKEELISYGFYMVDETQYKNTHTKIDFIDKDGYKYFTSYAYIVGSVRRNDVQEKIGKVNPYSIENLQLFIKKKGSSTIVLDKKYYNTKHKINLVCGCCGEKYQDTYDHIRIKEYVYCKKCGLQRSAEFNRHSVEEVKNTLESFGYKLLNDNFKNINHLEVEDKDGYRCSNFNLYDIENRKSFPRNHKSNLYTPYNINLYLQKQGICTQLVDATPRRIEVAKEKLGFVCNCCGNVFYSQFDILKRSGRVLCDDCSNTMSNLAYKVKMYLDENNIKYETEKRFEKCKKKRSLPFDFYLNDFNCVIEVNGSQHYYENNEYFHSSRTLQQQQEIDKYKKQFCIDNGIGYLELPFWLIENPQKTYKKKIDEIIGK